MKKIFNNIIFIIVFFIPLFLGFRFLLSSNYLVWGDAPFFFKEGLKEIFFEPHAWVERGNTLGGINPFLWLSPWMVLYGALGSLFNLSNSLIIRILFYFPSIILSLTGSYLLGKYLKLSKVSLLLTSLFYVFNTYYLLILDGGQVGIALVYGLFPLLILFLKKLFDKQNIINFFMVLLISFITTSIDPRFYVIGLLTISIWQIFEAIIEKKIIYLRGFIYLIFSLIILVPLNFYWIYPYLKLGIPKLSTQVTSLSLNSLLNSLFLYQPHWFQNIYGKVTYPPFYFVLIPILIFFNLFIKNNKKFLSIIGTFLVLAFFSKGSTPPFEQIFNLFIEHVPFAEVFRDFSKLFTPLMLFGGILIANTIDKLKYKYSNNKFIASFCFLYILFLVSPLFLGKLKWNLSERNNLSFETINNIIREDGSDYFRTAWFYEKPPIVFETREKPSLDARDLVGFRPFSFLNVGSYDSLNFMHQGNWQDWFRLLGIKYLVFTGNQRQIDTSENEIIDWNNFIEFIETQKGIEKIDKSEDTPLYELNNLTPRMFGLNKLFVVVGSDDIYEKIEKINTSFSRSNQGFVFSEDGLLDPVFLTEAEPESAVLVFNSKDRIDLTLSLLKDYFIDPLNYKDSNWSTWSQDNYLESKFQLLIRGVDLKEFNFNKGIAFSTQEEEKISFKVNIDKKGEYVPVFRVLNSKDSKGVQINYNSKSSALNSLKINNYNWYIKEPITLEKGKTLLEFKNLGGLNVINTFGFIPKEDFEKASKLTDELIDKFQTIYLDNPNDINILLKYILGQNWKELSYTNQKVLKFDFLEIPKEVNWVVLSQKYDTNWQLLRGDMVYESLPFYSMINGFYVDEKWQKFEISYKGQEYFRWGLYVTTISTLLSIIVFICLQDERENN